MKPHRRKGERREGKQPALGVVSMGYTDKGQRPTSISKDCAVLRAGMRRQRDAAQRAETSSHPKLQVKTLEKKVIWVKDETPP